MFQMHRYDFFLLMSASRFSENDTWLGNEIARSRRNYFYVRTKIAADISSDRKAHPRTHDEQAVIGDIRENVVAHLKARDSLLYAGAVYIYIYTAIARGLVAWHSGRTSVSDWRTFPVLRSTCS